MAEEKELSKYDQYFHQGGKNVVYVGTDQPFFNTIKYKTLKPYEKTGIDFHWLNFRDFECYEQCYIEVLRLRPVYIYLDFTVDEETIQKIGKLLTQEPLTSQIPIVAMVNNRSMAEKVNFYPYMFVHFKGGEHHDIIYDPVDISFPESVKKPEFAKASFTFETSLFEDVKVGYITPKLIHAEGNLKVAPGQIITVESDIPKDRVPSQRFFVRNVGAEGLYYSVNYFYDFEFQFADEPEFNNDELEDAKKIANKKIRLAKIKHIKMDRQERIDQYHHKMEHAKKEHLNWVEDNMDGSVPRKFKMLIVDPEMCILRYEDDVLSKSKYNYRFQTNFSENFAEVVAMQPSIICINLWDGPFLEKMIRVKADGKDVERDLNDEEEQALSEILAEVTTEKEAQISHIIRLIKNTGSYRPIVVLFNAREIRSSGLQKKYAYPFIMCHEQKINSSHIEGMANAFQLKMEAQYQEEQKKKAEMLAKMAKENEGEKKQDLREKMVYMTGNHPYRKASISVPITIKQLTESEIIFATEYSFQVGQKFRLESPIGMFLTITMNEGEVSQKVEGFNEYRGLIHGVDELGKKYLRKFVNEVIFSPLKAEREAEAEAFKKLNDTAKKIREEQEAERKEKESAAS